MNKTDYSQEIEHSFLKQDFKVKLSWKNLNFIEKKQQKIILENLSGDVRSGDFLTIMGSSGAGKSTFLSLITKSFSAYGKNFILKGKILLNNQDYNQDDFYSITSYVPQDDLLLDTLTVSEVFNFQAQLKMFNEPEEERQKSISQILRLLNLYEIRNSYIGGNGKKSISGGQKKRVAIGIELISNPLCLILDEPTSGLDSSNSFRIIKLLSKLAKQENKLIIATIHQPSTLMFQNFDKLMVLHKGKQVYYDEASKIVNYMESLNINVDYRMNPVDFLMLEISSFKQIQNYQTPMTYQSFYNYKEKHKMVINPQQISQYQSIDFTSRQSAPISAQIKPLLTRNFKNFIRNPSNQGGRIMQLIIFPLLIGTIFYDIMDRSPFVNPQRSMQTFLLQLISFFYISLFFTICQSVYDTLLSFPTQKQLVLKEVHSKMYYISVYYVSKLMIELPMMFLSVIISSSTVFLIVGLENQITHWLYYLFSFTMVALGGYMIGVAIGGMCKSQFIAIQAGVMIMMPVMTFGGQGVNLRTIPGYSSWFQYVTPLRYGYNILMRNHLQSGLYNFMGDNPKVQQFLGLYDTPFDNMIGLILLCYGLTVLSFLILYARKKLS